MKSLAYLRDFLLVLFVIYYGQGILYAKGTTITKLAFLLILGISAFYLGKTLFSNVNKNGFYYTWSALLILNVVGFIFTGSSSNLYHEEMFKGILLTLLPFYPFYYFAHQDMLKAKHLLRFFIVMLPITIVQYYLNAASILSERISDNTDLVNNIAYSFVGLLPFTFLFKKKRMLSIAAMAVLLFFIIQGAKRGALIAGAIGLFGFIYFQFKMDEESRSFKNYLYVIVAVLGISYYAYDTFIQNEYLISRIENMINEGGSSGRDKIYATIFNSWLESDSYLNLLGGFGFASSLELSNTGNFAHNDWLELLSNFGLLGIWIYTLLFYFTAKYALLKDWTINKKVVLVTIVLIWFFTTLVSMFYTSLNGYIYSILLAYLFGNESAEIE